jgi:WD40 repeat protein
MIRLGNLRHRTRTRTRNLDGVDDGTPVSAEFSDVLAQYRKRQLGEFDVFQRLTGSEQFWWRRCREAACPGTSPLSQPEADMALEVLRRGEPPESRSTVADAAAAAIWVSRALARDKHVAGNARAVLSPAAGGNDGLGELVISAAAVWDSDGPAMPMPRGGTPVSLEKAVALVQPDMRDRIRRLLGSLEEPVLSRGQAMVVVSALLLAGVRLDTRPAVRVRVILASPRQDRKGLHGVTGVLDVRELPGGPGGLFPDPSALRIYRTNDSFNQALTLAWEFAAGDRHNGKCALWRLILEADVPDFAIDGGSLGAALAIALRELLSGHPVSGLDAIGMLRGFFLRLRPDCAVTGELSWQRPAFYIDVSARDKPPWLDTVGAMDAKLEAAEDKQWRLVAPAANRAAYESSAPVPVYWAKTIRQADRYARRARPTRVLAAASAAIIVVVGLIAGTLVRNSDTDTQRQHAQDVSAQLTSTANDVRSTNPALAAQFDIAAYHADPTASAYTSMLNDESSPLDTVFSYNDIVGAMALSPSGNALAASADDGITLWKIGDPAQAPVRIGGSLGDGTAGELPVVFSPGGNLLAAAAPDGAIRLWNVTDLAHPVPLSAPFGTVVTSAAFSPSGRILATGTQNGSVVLWNVATPTRPRAVSQLPTAGGRDGGYTASLTFTGDGSTLDAASQAGGVGEWSVANPASPRLISQPIPPALGQHDTTAFSQNGQAVITDASGNTFLYQLSSPGTAATVTSGGDAEPAVISPDGTVIATENQSGSISLLNAVQPDKYPLGPSLSAGATSTGIMAFDAAGNMLAAASASGIILWHLPSAYFVDSYLPLAAQLQPDGIDAGMAAVVDGSNISVQDLADPAQTHVVVYGATTGVVLATAAIGAGGRLLASSGGNTTTLWNVANPARPSPLGAPFAAAGWGLALSANGRILAVTTEAGTTQLWNVTDPAHPAALGPPFGTGASLPVLSPDGQTLALLSRSQGSYVVSLWNLADPGHPVPIGAPVIVGTQASGTIPTALALSPGGRMLAVATERGTVNLWSLVPRALPYGEVLTSNFDMYYDFLITRTNSVGVNALAFSPNGQTLTAINANSTVRSWELQVPTEIAYICAATQQTLTAAIWSQYLPGVPYQAPCPTDQAKPAPGQAQATPTPEADTGGTAAKLCTASDLTVSLGAAVTGQYPGEPTAPLILTNISHVACILSGIPTVSLVGAPDPPLGGTYQLTTTAVSGQVPLTVPPGSQAHVNLTYLRAQFQGDGGGDWIPQLVTITLLGTHSTLTIRWKSGEPVVRQDTASAKGSYTGPFLSGSTGGTQPAASPSLPASPAPAGTLGGLNSQTGVNPRGTPAPS